MNVASNRLIAHRWYVPFAVASALVTLAFARLVDRRTWDDLGLARANLRRGAAWGGALIGVVLVAYLIGIFIPGTRDLFRDERVHGWSFGRTLDAVFIRVPLGTVLVVRERSGPLVISRYNMYPAAAVNGNFAPGVSTGDGIALMEKLAERELPGRMAYE